MVYFDKTTIQLKKRANFIDLINDKEWRRQKCAKTEHMLVHSKGFFHNVTSLLQQVFIVLSKVAIQAIGVAIYFVRQALNPGSEASYQLTVLIIMPLLC